MSLDAQTLRRRRVAERRERRRRQVRRRRATALAVVAAIVVVIVAVASSGGSASAPPQAAAPPHHRTAAVATPNAQQAAVARLAAAGRPIYCAARRRRVVALTFDDGPGPYTRLALRKLHAAHVPATFFLVGKEVDAYRALPPVEGAAAAIGDHTYTHPQLTALDPSAMQSEISRAQTRISQAAHVPVRLFRPPYGARNPAIDGEAKALDMVEILWDVDTRDSEGADYAGIAANVRRQVRPGSIVLMHENRGQTIRALDHVIQTLRRKHLRPVTVPELLAADPPTAAQLAAGPNGCGASAGSKGES
ncbi:MAG TPA: polysaccharide deacetylase family protein [Solirubrobacteraceae bacterium]|nr:polysaccharide deacetylase family protein [Solirubrobacteraceae bacterium]